MKLTFRTLGLFRSLILLTSGGFLAVPLLAQPQGGPTKQDLPPEVRGAKVYKLDESKLKSSPEKLAVYRSMAYEDINMERLALNLYMSLRPVDRPATVKRVYFQDIRVNGVPIHVQTYDEVFKLSKKTTVDLPGPIKCKIIFSDLDSLVPVRDIVRDNQLQVTGQSFIEVKLTAVQKLALRTKRLIIPAKINETIPLQMFSESPFLQAGVTKILDFITDPKSSAAVTLAKEHMEKLTQQKALASIGEASLFLVHCEYMLKNPRTGTGEKFAQTGTAFSVAEDGKLLTAKRVIEPWKFDPEIASMAKKYELEIEPQSYRLYAWPAGSKVLGADGRPDWQAAFSNEKASLQVLKMTPDKLEPVDYTDLDSGEKIQLPLHTGGEHDLALLQLAGTKTQPLTLASSDTKVSPEMDVSLLGFPFGFSQAMAEPRASAVKTALSGSLLSLDRQLNPGESGAPLIDLNTKNVICVAGGAMECIPIGAAGTLLQ